MTDAAIDSRLVPLGRRLIEQLTAGDLTGAGLVLAPTIEFKALTPGRLVEADGRVATAEVLAEWFPPGRVEALEMVEVGAIGDRQRVSYRVRWTDPDGASLVFEQHAYYDRGDSGITWLRLVCSGDHPARASAAYA